MYIHAKNKHMLLLASGLFLISWQTLAARSECFYFEKIFVYCIYIQGQFFYVEHSWVKIKHIAALYPCV